MQNDDSEQVIECSREKWAKRRKSSHHTELITTEPSWISERIEEEFVRVEMTEEEGPVMSAHGSDTDFPIDEFPELPEDLSCAELPMTSMASRNELQTDLCK